MIKHILTIIMELQPQFHEFNIFKDFITTRKNQSIENPALSPLQ